MSDTPNTTEQSGADLENFDVSAVIAKHAPALLGEEAPKTEAAPPPAPEAPKVEEKPPEDLSLRARQLATLARREAEMKSKEESFEKQLEAKAAAVREELKAMFRNDPVAFAKELGVEELDKIANQYVAAKLGDDAPIELRMRAMEAKWQQENAALRKQIDDQKEAAKSAASQAAHATKVEAVEKEILSLVGQVPTDLPNLGVSASDDPEGTAHLIAETMAHVINETGRWPSVREVAAAVEEELAATVAKFTGTTKTAKQAPIATQRVTERETPSTLSNADAATRPDRQPEGLLDTDEYIKRAVEAARQRGYR